MPRISHALASASLLLSAIPVLAEDSPETTAEPIIVTADRLDDAQARTTRTPGGANVVSAKDYADKAAVSLRDALAFSPGVYTQPRFGQEVRLSIRGSGLSRGFHMRGLTLLQDGIPINMADNNGDFQELDPTIMSHLEVYRGSNALRFGSSTLGGAINAVTPTGRTAPGITLRIDGGSFDTLRGLASAGFSDDRADAWVALAADRSDGDRDHARRLALRFNGNVGIRLTDRIETRFYASVQQIRQDLPGALSMADVLTNPATSLPANITGDQQRDIDSIRLQNRTRFALGDGTLDIGLFLNAKQLFHPIFQVIDQKSTDWGSYARYDRDWGRFALTLGGTARWGNVAAKQFVNVAGRRGAPTADARQSARTIDLYGELRFRPIDTLSLIAGAVHVEGRRSVDNRFNPVASDSQSFNQFSPKLGLLFEPGSTVQFYANYSRSAEIPGFSELAQAQPVPGFVPLDAQTAWTAEIGTRGEWGPARWDISLYRADLKGELLQYSVIPGLIPAATFNAGRTRHQGVEAGLDLDLTRWARLRQSWQYADFRFRGDVQFGGNRLPVIAPHLYRAALRLGGDRFSVTPNVEWVPRGAWADYANSVRTDGYALLGATAHAELRQGITLFLDARNLTGKKAVGDISAVVKVNGPAQALYYPVERRAVSVGVNARF